MKKHIAMAALAAACCTPAFAQTSVSISVGQPGFYGQINIGGYPQPALVYEQPVIIHQAPEYVGMAPIYLHVPPGHEKHWSKHCGAYHACGRPVYFVRDDWYQREYVPRYQQGHGRDDDQGRGRGPDHGEGRGEGHGKGHGKGHGHD